MVTLASPGCKDWAAAQARELTFIPNDWTALRWAIGSTRVLLDRRDVPTGSRSEFPARPNYLDVLSWLFHLTLGFDFCLFLLTSKSWNQRLGWSLVLLGWSYWAVCSVFDWLRERWQPPTSDIVAYRLFLREGLELKLAQYRTVRRWFPTLASLSALVGYDLTVKGEVHFWWYVILIAWVALNSSETPAKIQSRIERMDVRIAEGLPANLKLPVKRLHSDHWGRPQAGL